MRMAERHAELDEQRQADEWAAYLEWEAAGLQLNELQGEQDEWNGLRAVSSTEVQAYARRPNAGGSSNSENRAI